MRVRFEGVSKQFGAHAALRDVHLDVEPGECLVLLGPSGCGKTTMLRLLTGLERADAGRIAILQNGAVVQVGAPLELYRRLANTFVATFLGNPAMHILDGARGGTAITIGIRPEDVQMSTTPQEGSGCLTAADPPDNVPDQNPTLNENCMTRGSPASAEMTPALAPAIFDAGRPKFA